MLLMHKLTRYISERKVQFFKGILPGNKYLARNEVPCIHSIPAKDPSMRTHIIHKYATLIKLANTIPFKPALRRHSQGLKS